jgi:hypothetical protein
MEALLSEALHHELIASQLENTAEHAVTAERYRLLAHAGSLRLSALQMRDKLTDNSR